MSEEEAIERLKERVKLDRKIRNNKIESDYEQFCENECQAIETILNITENQQKEIEEKTTIIMAGAEKVKQLEKEIEELHKEINQRIKLKLENEKCAEKDFVYKGKIKEKIKELSKKQDFKVGLENYTIKILKELLEGK